MRQTLPPDEGDKEAWAGVSKLLDSQVTAEGTTDRCCAAGKPGHLLKGRGACATAIQGASVGRGHSSSQILIHPVFEIDKAEVTTLAVRTSFRRFVEILEPVAADHEG